MHEALKHCLQIPNCRQALLQNADHLADCLSATSGISSESGFLIFATFVNSVFLLCFVLQWR
jgi:hypothetical protein